MKVHFKLGLTKHLSYFLMPHNFQYFDQTFDHSFRLPYQTTQNYVVLDGTKSMGILPVVETMDYSKS